ncbi:hypothetical protein K4S01_02945 [Staphylococcus epidermidis]|nr:hypothetical protein [Staphylococcus epidermidis]
MKKVLASATILSLMLVGCSNGGNNESSHKDDSSKTEQKDKSSSQHDSKKDSKRNDTNNKQDNQENNTNKEQTNNQNPNDGEQRTSERPTTNSNGNSSDNQNKQQQSVQDNQNKYVAPYQSENATRVARYLSPFEGDRSQALQQLPNFETALSIAKNEANMYGSENKSYNDYSIEQTEDGFRYVFSFKDPSKSNTYSIVTLNRQGQPTVVDPNFQP